MSPTTVVLTREQLYERVWADPLRSLARRLWLSDVALAKRCRKLRIPLPGQGFWAKKAAGHRVRMTMLPEAVAADAQHAHLLHFTLPAEPEHGAKQAAAVLSQEAFESDERNRIVVARTLRAPHPLVKRTAEAFANCGKSPTDTVQGREECVDIRVSRAVACRALRIAEALVRACEARGWTVLASREHPWRSFVLIAGQKVPFALREKIRRVKNEPAKPIRSYDGKMYTPYRSAHRDEPTGRLFLAIPDTWLKASEARTRWDEKDSAPLEALLNQIMVGFVAYAEYRNEWQREVERRAAQRLVEETQRREEARRREEEEERRRILQADAKHWALALELRTYLSALEEAGRAAGTRIDDEWLQWARAHAEALDPLPSRVAELRLGGAKSTDS